MDFYTVYYHQHLTVSPRNVDMNSDGLNIVTLAKSTIFPDIVGQDIKIDEFGNVKIYQLKPVLT